MAYATLGMAAQDRGRVKIGQLISACWRTLVGARGRLLLPWAALTVVQLVIRLSAQFVGLDSAQLLQSVPGLVMTTAMSVGTAVILAGVTRTLLGREEDAWNMDGGAVGFIALTVAMNMAMALLVFAVAPPVDGSQAVMVAYGLRVLGVGVGMIALTVAMIGLTLLPVGVLMRNAEITVGRAWALMQGAKLSCIVAAAVLSGIPAIVAGFLAGVGRVIGPGGLPLIALSVACTSVATLCAAAVTAELYRVRVAPGQYGEVFD